MKKSNSRRRHSAVSHAIALTQLSPGIASKRLAQFRVASPMQAFEMLANMMSEKVFAFGHAYINSFVAIASAQASLVRLAISSSTPNGASRAPPEAMSLLFRSGREIARASLAPLARQVRRNSR